MTFPTGWQWKCSLTIDHAQVGASGVTGFPMLLTEANLPAQLLNSGGDGPALSDGGDIRITADEAGTAALALEIVLFELDGTVRMFVKVNASDSSDTEIWVWWGMSGQSQPGSGAANGRNAVWSNGFEAVYHFADDPDGGVLTDSTGNGYVGTTGGGTIVRTSQGWEFGGGSGGGYVEVADQLPSPLATEWTIDAVFPSDAVGQLSGLRTPGLSIEHQIGYGNDGAGILSNNTRNAGGSIVTNEITGADAEEPVVACLRRNSDDLTMDVQGGAISDTKTRPGGTYSVSANTTIAAIYAGGVVDASSRWTGGIRFIAYSNVVRTDEWVLTAYHSLSAPGDFASAGTPEEITPPPVIRVPAEFQTYVNAGAGVPPWIPNW